MDSTLWGYIETLAENYLNSYLKSNSLFGTANSLTNIPGYIWLSYMGAIFAFFFSLAGAYNTVATAIIALEADFYAFIDEYQGD